MLCCKVVWVWLVIKEKKKMDLPTGEVVRFRAEVFYSSGKASNITKIHSSLSPPPPCTCSHHSSSSALFLRYFITRQILHDLLQQLNVFFANLPSSQCYNHVHANMVTVCEQWNERGAFTSDHHVWSSPLYHHCRLWGRQIEDRTDVSNNKWLIIRFSEIDTFCNLGI